MTEWSDTALVLRVGRFREADIWLRLFTRRHGIVSAFAFGGSRSRRRFCGCLDLFNELRIRMKSTRNGQYLTLEEGMLLNGPRRLRTDRNRLGMFMNCVQFMETLGVPSDNSNEVFSTLTTMLGLLESAESVPAAIPILFRLRLASDLGYAPAFSACSACGRQSPPGARFLIPEGTLICAACVAMKDVREGIRLSGASLELLRRVQALSPFEWDFSGEQSGVQAPEEHRACMKAIDGFIQYHLGIVWENGRFRRL